MSNNQTINVGDQFVATYDGYSMSYIVKSVKGKTAELYDRICEETIQKRIKVKDGYRPSFMHNQHFYRLENDMDVAESNQLKLY